MIESILEKAKNREKLSKSELIQLFEIDDEENLKKLCNIACEIRNECSDVIKLTSTIHLTNKCQVQPRCKYCGFAAKTSSIGYYDAFYKSDESDIMMHSISLMMRYVKLQCVLKDQAFLE